MKIILLKDVKTLGKKGDVVEATDGYGRNFLIREKLGIEATPAALNDLKLQKENEAKIAAKRLKDAKAFKEVLETKTICVEVKTGVSARMFGSVTPKDISDAAKKQYDFDLDKRKFIIKEPIREFGNYEIPFKLHPQVMATVKVKVVRV